MIAKRWYVGVAALALTGAACSHGESAQRTAAPAPPRSAAAEAQPRGGAGPSAMGGGRMAAVCPMAVPGTQVSASDTATGEALTFSSPSTDQVADLRSRVHAMADMHNQHHSEGGMGGMQGMHGHGGVMGSGTGSGAGMARMMPPPSTASVEDTETGARLVLTPKDPAQLSQLQSAVRAHADMMKSGRCAMMGGGAQAQ